MATWRDVRRIALALPDAEESRTDGGTTRWAVRGKAFAWERPLRRSDLEALGARAPGGPILGVRTADLETKDALLQANPGAFFTTPHFDGYAAVLVALAKVRTPALRAVLIDGWLARAPRRATAAYLASSKASRA